MPSIGDAGPGNEYALNDASQVRARNVSVQAVRYGGSDALEVRLKGSYRGPDMDTFAYVPGLDFHDGTIEVDVVGTVLPDAPRDARGFIGIAFRIDAQGGTFACEGLYIRPTNARADDQIRRNHSTQYFSYPGYDFDRLRRAAPSQYESYADIVPGEWTHLRIEVSGSVARLYVGSATQPALIVPDLSVALRHMEPSASSWTTARTVTSAICRFIHAELHKLIGRERAGSGSEILKHVGEFGTASNGYGGIYGQQEQQARVLYMQSGQRTRAVGRVEMWRGGGRSEHRCCRPFG